MTWSARARSDGGIVRPSALAVLRLMTSSNLVGCSMGKSPGLALLRILSACGTHQARIGPRDHDDRNRGGRPPRRVCRGRARCHEKIDARPDQLSRQSRDMIRRISPSDVESNCPPVDPAQLADFFGKSIEFTTLSLVRGRTGE